MSLFMYHNSQSFHYLALLSLVGFGAASIIELMIYQNKNSPVLKYASLAAFILATLSCLLVEINLLVSHDGTKIGHPLAGFLISSILSLGVLYLRLFRKIILVSVVASPVICLILFFQVFFVPSAAIHAAIAGPQMTRPLSFHIYTSVVGQAEAILAAVIGAMYLFIDRQVKQKNMKFLMQSSSSLKTLKTLMLGLLWCGFIFMSIGLVSGAYLALFHSEILQDFNTTIKTAWALAVWLWYLLTLFFYSVLSAHLTRVAKMTLVGFVIISLPFYGVFFKN